MLGIRPESSQSTSFAGVRQKARRSCLRELQFAQALKGDALPEKAKTSSARLKKMTRQRAQDARGQPKPDDVEREVRIKLFDLKSPSRPYSDQLKDPIVRASKLEILVRGGPEEQERLGRSEDTRIVVEQLRKFLLLLDHFEIPPNAPDRWFRLALELARQHVPGMKIVHGPSPNKGPKRKWRETQLSADLMLAVAAVKREPRTWRGAADAIRLLRKRHPTTWGRFGYPSLRRRYYEALKEFEPYRRDTMLESLAAWLLPEASQK